MTYRRLAGGRLTGGRLAGWHLAVAAGALALAGCGGGQDNAAESAEEAASVSDIRIDGERVFPESITSDASGNIYVGSGHNIVYRAEAGSEVATPWISEAGAEGSEGVFGVLADDANSRLWICTNPDLFGGGEASGPALLRAFNLQTGELEASYELPSDGLVICNDIAVGPDGTVFATETMLGGIYALAPGADALELWASGEDLIGVDGIAFSGDGVMYVNNVRENLVQRVEREDDGAYRGLTNLTLSQPVSGPDGLRPLGGNRFIQSEGPAGRVALVTVDGDSANVETVHEGLESAPAVTTVGDVGYAIEGKIQYRTDPELRDQDPGEFMIRAFPLPGQP